MGSPKTGPLVTCHQCGASNRLKSSQALPRCGKCKAPLDELEGTIQFAVGEGKRAYQELAAQIDQGMDRLQKAQRMLRPWLSQSKDPIGEDVGKLAREFTRLVDDRHEEVQALMKRQRDALDTFNIALFGRTGAGKSTLMETFSRGNGKAVSDGRSDWTTDVHPVAWNQCRLIDTPGIGGWGRTQSRQSLEAKAREAVEVADVVVLCFDSQSQQAGEFEKVANWIQRYGKPVIAVLNCRNQRWRMPTVVKIPAARRNLSQAVVEHTGNIRDELAAICLPGVPVVAISSKRALFARATEPFSGNDTESFASLRALHGTEALLEWSNFTALEQLLVGGIRRDAAGLRLGMLSEQVRGVLTDVRDKVGETGEFVRHQSDTMENSIAQLLKVVGYPPQAGQARVAFRDARAQQDLLTDLEDLRGEPFKAPVSGEFQAYLRHSLEAALGPMRRKALSEAELAISSAFDRRQELSSEEFSRRVFKETELKEAARTVIEDAVQFMHRKTKLALKDAKTDFACMLDDIQSIKGGAGGWLKALGYASNIAGIIGGLMGALAVANIWNPIGWAAGVVGALGAAASFLFGWLGDKAKKQAEANRLAERRRAIADAKRAVHDAFDRLHTQITAECDNIAHKAMGQLLVEPTRMAVVLRLLGNECQSTAGHLDAMIAGLPAQRSGAIFQEAAQQLEQALYPGDPAAGRKLWLGESWITEGHADELTSVVPEARTTGPNEHLSQRFEEALSASLAGPEPGAGGRWLKAARKLLRHDAQGDEVLVALEALAAAKKPRVMLCGDYNAGKSSFIKRVLLSLGRPVPEGLDVKARPTTSQATAYDAGEFLLVDIPGFQSTREQDTTVALRSCPDASILLYLFQPNLLLGEAAFLEQVLLGANVGTAKLARTVFVINRADELGVDPLVSPEEFDRLCVRKQQELVKALESRRITVDGRRVFCMASDPYNLIGDSRDGEVQSFAWDGFAELMEALKAVNWSNGVDISVLEGGIARLTQLAAAGHEEVVHIDAQLQALERLEEIVGGSAGEAQRIAGDLRGRLGRLVDEQAFGLLQDVFSATNPAELEAQARQLSHWWDDKAFKLEIDRWQAQAQEDIDEWVKRTQESIARRLRSAEFKKAFPKIEAEFEGQRLSRKGNGMGKGAQVFGRLLKEGARRDLVYGIGKAVGTKFKPYGAVNMAKNIGKAGAVLAFVGVVLDTAFLIKGFFDEKKRDKARKDAQDFVLQSAQQVVGYYGDDAQGEGPLGYLASRRKELEEHQAQLTSEREQLMAHREAVIGRTTIYRRLVDDAHTALTLNKEAIPS